MWSMQQALTCVHKFVGGVHAGLSVHLWIFDKPVHKLNLASNGWAVQSIHIYGYVYTGAKKCNAVVGKCIL